MDHTNKKALFLTDMEIGLEPILQQETNISPENMLLIQSYSPVISHPYGEIMRSIILAIYQEKVEEIFVVGSKNKRYVSVDIPNLLQSDNKDMDDKLKTVDYLLKNCRPKFSGASVKDWLRIDEDIEESIKKSAEIIRRHPLVPTDIKIHGLLINKQGELATINQ